MARSATVEAETDSKPRGRPVGAPIVQRRVTFQPVAAMPDKATGGGGHRNTELHGAFAAIQSDSSLHSRPFELVTFEAGEKSRGSATAQGSSLRKKYPENEGWTIRVGDSQVEPGKVGLFAQYG